MHREISKVKQKIINMMMAHFGSQEMETTSGEIYQRCMSLFLKHMNKISIQFF